MTEKTEKATSGRPWKRIGWTLERGFNDFRRRYRVRKGTATEDDLRYLLKASASGNRIRPISRSIFYCDLKRFRDLSASRHVEFHRLLEYLCTLSAGMAGGSPLSVSIWGDAVLGIFSSTSEAASFSLAFKAAAATVSWRSYGLAADTGFRLALHQGLLQSHQDKVINRTVYLGTGITFAARLQEAAIAGKEVLTSTAFANLLNASDDPRYECRSVGKRYLLKAKILCPAFELLHKPCTE